MYRLRYIALGRARSLLAESRRRSYKFMRVGRVERTGGRARCATGAIRSCDFTKRFEYFLSLAGIKPAGAGDVIVRSLSRRDQARRNTRSLLG